MTTGGGERRSDPRYAAHFDVRFDRVKEAARAFKVYSINFSSGGLCLRTSGSYAVGEALSLDLTIEGGLFQLDAVVSWARGEVVGVRFVNLLPAQRERLERVARVIATKHSPVT